VPLVFEEVFRKIFFFLLGVIHVFPTLSNMVNCTLNHSSTRLVDGEGFVPVYFGLGGHLRVIELLAESRHSLIELLLMSAHCGTVAIASPV